VVTAGLGHEIRTVLWLQSRLLRNAVRRGRRSGLGHVVMLVILVLAITPYIIGGAIGLGIALHVADPGAVTSIISVAFTVALLLWIASPGASQQLVEGPNLARLLVHPISLRGLILGGLVTSSVSVVGLITVPFLLAVWIGSARDLPSAAVILPVIALFFVFLVILKALVGDVFDLIAEDRRLRGIAGFLVFIPFFIVYFVGFGIQDIGRTHSAMPFAQLLSAAPALRWLPPGWFGLAVQAAAARNVAGLVAACASLLAAVACGLVLHYWLLGLIYSGTLVQSAPARQRASRPLRDQGLLPGLSKTDSMTFRALVRKDWLNLRRSPMTLRLAFTPILFTVMMFFITRNSGLSAQTMTLGAGTMAALSVGVLSINSLGLLDHRGLATLLLSPAPRQLVLLSHGLMFVVLATGIGLLVGGGVAAATLQPVAVPATALVALLVQLSFNGLAHWTSVRLPRYVDLERGRASSNEASLMASFVLMLGLPLINVPTYAILALAWIFARSWLPVAFLGALVYALVVYAVSLRFAARTLTRDEERLIQEIVEAR
jgi:hypothetical protein